MFSHLIVPFAAGAVDREVVIDAVGVGTADWNAREPELLVALAKPLEEQGLRVSGTLDPGGANTALGELEFFPYSESGGRPFVVSPADGWSIGQHVHDTAHRQPRRQGRHVDPIAPVAIASIVTLRLIEGVLARLLYIAGAEKQRIRRQAREIIAMRRIDAARDHALDRIGADLGVPRFADQLSVPPPGTGELVTTIRREPDAEYRPRLRIYRPFLIPIGARCSTNSTARARSRRRMPVSHGSGRRPQRFSVLESNNPFAIAIHLVAAGPDARRINFLKFLRAAHLVQPLAAMPADNVVPENAA